MLSNALPAAGSFLITSLICSHRLIHIIYNMFLSGPLLLRQARNTGRQRPIGMAGLEQDRGPSSIKKCIAQGSEKMLGTGHKFIVSEGTGGVGSLLGGGMPWLFYFLSRGVGSPTWAGGGTPLEGGYTYVTRISLLGA